MKVFDINITSLDRRQVYASFSSYNRREGRLRRWRRAAKRGGGARVQRGEGYANPYLLRVGTMVHSTLIRMLLWFRLPCQWAWHY